MYFWFPTWVVVNYICSHTHTAPTDALCVRPMLLPLKKKPNRLARKKGSRDCGALMVSVSWTMFMAFEFL